LNERGYKEILDKLLSGSIYIHAGFARQVTSPDKALQGWREILDRKNKECLQREHRQACTALAAEISEENENRMLALYNMQKTGDN
jgi:DNA primase